MGPPKSAMSSGSAALLSVMYHICYDSKYVFCIAALKYLIRLVRFAKFESDISL